MPSLLDYAASSRKFVAASSIIWDAQFSDHAATKFVLEFRSSRPVFVSLRGSVGTLMRVLNGCARNPIVLVLMVCLSPSKICVLSFLPIGQILVLVVFVVEADSHSF